MSFDINYHTCNLGTGTATPKNPFTGEMHTVSVDDGLTDVERSGVRNLLNSAGAAEPDEFGCYAVEVKDGGSAEVFATELGESELCEGLMASVHGLTPELIKFLWELCRVGNMAAAPIMEEEMVVVVSEEQQRRVQSRWPAAVVVGSPDELGRLLGGGVAAWQAYRDNVAGK